MRNHSFLLSENDDSCTLIMRSAILVGLHLHGRGEPPKSRAMSNRRCPFIISRGCVGGAEEL